MEAFPEIKITVVDVAKAVGDLVMSAVRHLPESGYPSERGAAAMLDQQLNPLHQPAQPWGETE